jgi:hypothetical protein
MKQEDDSSGCNIIDSGLQDASKPGGSSGSYFGVVP